MTANMELTTKIKTYNKMDAREKLNEFAELRGWDKNKLIGWSEAADFGEWLAKNCSIPAVSVVREPVVLGAICPHFDTCQNGGKNKFCDLQTFKELDCFVGQTER